MSSKEHQLYKEEIQEESLSKLSVNNNRKDDQKHRHNNVIMIVIIVIIMLVVVVLGCLIFFRPKFFFKQQALPSSSLLPQQQIGPASGKKIKVIKRKKTLIKPLQARLFNGKIREEPASQPQSNNENAAQNIEQKVDKEEKDQEAIKDKELEEEEEEGEEGEETQTREEEKEKEKPLTPPARTLPPGFDKLLSWWRYQVLDKDPKKHTAQELIRDLLARFRPLRIEVPPPDCKFLSNFKSVSAEDLQKDLNNYLGSGTKDPNYNGPEEQHPELMRILVNPHGFIDQVLPIAKPDEKFKHESEVKQYYEQMVQPDVIKWLPVIEKLEIETSSEKQKALLLEIEQKLKKSHDSCIPYPLKDRFWSIFLKVNFKRSKSTLFTKKEYETFSKTIFSSDTTKPTTQIFKDIERTPLSKPHIRLLHPNSELRKALVRLLLGYVHQRNKMGDTSLYCQGMNLTGLIFLLTMNSEYDAFKAMVFFYDHPAMDGLTNSTMVTSLLLVEKMTALIMDLGVRLFDRFSGAFAFRQLSDDIYKLFRHHNIIKNGQDGGASEWVSKQAKKWFASRTEEEATKEAEIFRSQFLNISSWFISIFLYSYPTTLCMRAIDMLLCTGDIDSLMAITFGMISISIPELMKREPVDEGFPILIEVPKLSLFKDGKNLSKAMKLAWEYWDYIKNNSHAKNVMEKAVEAWKVKNPGIKTPIL